MDTDTWLELGKLLFAAVAAVAAGFGAWLALRNWQLGEANRKIALENSRLAAENTRIANINAENAAAWKRAELASSYLAPLFTDEELAFALRCIDWGVGEIPIPARHLSMFEREKTIQHDPVLVALAMQPALHPDVATRPQGMLYRLAFDALFTRFEWIGYRVSSKLIRIEDVPDLEYWMKQLATWRYAPPNVDGSLVFVPFLIAAGYDQTLKLVHEFASRPGPAPRT